MTNKNLLFIVMIMLLGGLALAAIEYAGRRDNGEGILPAALTISNDDAEDADGAAVRAVSGSMPLETVSP